MKPPILINCEHCSKSFEKSIYQSSRFCSRDCYMSYRKECKKKTYAQYQAQEIIHGRSLKEHKYHIYKTRAIAREISFEISFDQFLELWQKACIYCRSAIETIGVDRVDNTLGYIPGNIAPCCTTCNLMKRGMNAQAFIDHCKRVDNHQAETTAVLKDPGLSIT